MSLSWVFVAGPVFDGYHPDEITNRHTARPWYHHKTDPAFDDMFAELRRTPPRSPIRPSTQLSPTPT